VLIRIFFMPPTPPSPSPPLWSRLLAPVDIASLVYFRICFGAIMLWEVIRYFDHDRIGRYYITPGFHFKYYGFEWVQAWGALEMKMHFAALGILATCILVGFCYRIAAALFFLGFTYVFLLDQARYLNHFYLVSLISFLLIFVPAHRALSVDALMRPRLRSNVAPAWSLWLLRTQIGIVYFYGGIAKIASDWLQGEPMRMWLASRTDYPVLGPWFTQEWVVYAFAYGGLLLDILIVPLLLWSRTRWFALLWATSFHLLNAWLFYIGIFPWFMLCTALIFFPPEFPRRVWHFLTRQPQPQPVLEASTTTVRASRVEKFILPMLALHLLLQLLIPLRHFAYPGDVNWTEEGHLFSWHMKLRTKSGHTTFKVVDPATGRTWTVNPAMSLDDKQYRSLSTHPDMLLQFAHHLAEEAQRTTGAAVEVYAQTSASLNGRPMQALVDPTVDLAKVERSLGAAEWIVPLKEALPGPMKNKGGTPTKDKDADSE